MHHDFWHQRWQTNQIGFHLSVANPLLVKHFSSLNLPLGACVFLPLCGKTEDIPWLLSQGYKVAGAELSQVAIEDLFKRLQFTPIITQLNDLRHYSAPNIDIYVGDIFKLTADQLGKVDAVYDRAALVALPEDMRKQYTAHLMALTHTSPQLLICFEYDQTIHAGPPFSVVANEVNQHYAQAYTLELLESLEMADGLKGQYPATEQVWWLSSSTNVS
jgi:thiopurine S-methyltransferase